jgi:hypothetical protein
VHVSLANWLHNLKYQLNYDQHLVKGHLQLHKQQRQHPRRERRRWRLSQNQNRKCSQSNLSNNNHQGMIQHQGSSSGLLASVKHNLDHSQAVLA